MLNALLAATDLSHRSAPALQRAVQLVEWAGARLVVLHVVDDDQPEPLRHGTMRAAEAFLAQQLAGLGKPANCDIVTLPGHAFSVIAEEAATRGVDLVVLGAHRRRCLQDVFIGTTVERVIRTAGRPVLMANAEPGPRWQRVFIATDLSETSAHAAHTARDLGLFDGAEVTFVHAYAPVRQMMIDAGLPPLHVIATDEARFQEQRRAVDQFLEEYRLGDISDHVSLVEGAAASAITALVGRARPDLLILGTRGQSGVGRLLLGSVAQELMGSLEIDILAVPPQA